MITWSQVTELALRLRGSELSTSYGRPAVKVDDRTFVCKGKQDDHCVLMIEREQAEALIANEPGMFFRTEHYAKSDAVLVRYETADPDLVEVLLQRAWSRRAGRKKK